MKKPITLILALALSLCLLVGCGGGNGKTPDKKNDTQASETVQKENALTDGYWVVEKIEMDGTEFSGENMTGIFGPADSIMSLSFGEEYVYDAVFFEGYIKGTYSGSPEALEMDFGGESVKGTCSDGMLVLTTKDGTFTLKQQENRPEIFDKNPWTTYDPDFGAEETRAMSNFMAEGYYFIEDDILYGLTHTASANGGLGATPFYMKGDFPEFKETILLDGSGAATYLSKEGDYLYYIMNYEKVCRIKTDGSDAKVLYNGICDYLQIHEGRLYFTDENYHFVSTDMDGGDLRTIVDKEIYYPYFIGSDWMIFQDNADDESLHLYNTTHSTELNVTYVPSYNPILDGKYLYYTDMAEDAYFLCRVDISDPDAFYFDGSDQPLWESSFLIDEGFFYTTNNNSVAKTDWKKLSDTKEATEVIEMNVSEGYTVYHELDSDGFISSKYLMSKEKFGGSPFQ